MGSIQLAAIVISLGITAVALVITAQAVWKMVRVIRTGQRISRHDNPVGRSITMVKETLLHTRMLQWHWVGAMHWFVYAAFLFLSSAVAAGYFQLFNPRFEIPVAGGWYVYGWTAEFLGLLGTLGIIFLIIYRQLNHPRSEGRQSRFFGSNMWQAYFVEGMVLLESAAILFIRGAEYKLLEGASKLHFPLSHVVGQLFYPDDAESLKNIIYIVALIKIASAMIWLMVISANLTMGVAWHRFTAWPNIWFKREGSGRTALGAMAPMTSDGEVVMLDDLEEMDEDTVLGVGKVEDFSWKGLLDFTSCTECGRCQSQCPAWNTEKPLSPKLLITNLRDHAYAKAPYLLEQDEGKRQELPAATLAEAERPLVGQTEGDWAYLPEGGAVIDDDVLWSCTSCGACVQQCPVDIEHVDHIMNMRRYQVLVESNFPGELNQLFKGLENKGNPWNQSATARMDWAKDLPFEVKVVGEDVESLDEVDWLFWVGCAGAYEDRAKKTTRAVAELLDTAGVSFAVLGNGETCTGDPARRAGNEFVFQGLATQNAETFKERQVKKVVSTCAHCFNTLKNEYAEFGVELEVVHHTQLLNRLVREKKLAPVAAPGGPTRTLTYHDPCFLGRHNDVYTPPRELLEIIPDASFTEMPRHGKQSFCCGAGGARMWMEENIGERINVNRTKEAVATGADQIAVGCPFCRVMLSDGLTAEQHSGNAREEVEVLDVAQLLLASVKGEQYAKAGAPEARETAKTGSESAKQAGARAGAAAGAAETDDATKPEPDSGDATQTQETVTETADVGPAAKASGGSSLFDLAEADETPQETPDKAPAKAPVATSDEAKPASGGSLFDLGGDDSATTEAPDATPASDTTTNTAAAESTPTENSEPSATATESGGDDAGFGGGSLFDLGGDEDAVGDSTTDGPVDRSQDDADTDVSPAASSEATPAETPATTDAAKTSSTPSADIPEGGSLFDIEAPAEPATPTPAPAPEPDPSATTDDAATDDTAAAAAGEDAAGDSTTDGPVDRSQDDADTDVAPETTPDEPTPAPTETAKTSSTPSAEIPEGGSLFDIEAPAEPATPAPEPAPEPATEPDQSATTDDAATDDTAAAAAGEDAAGDSTTDGPVDRSQDDADTDVTPEQPVDDTSADEEPVEEKPESAGAGEAHQPRTDTDIADTGSLFDL